jgi:hypothetical protein
MNSQWSSCHPLIVSRTYGLTLDGMTFMEHYPAEERTGMGREETCDLVTFGWQDVETVFNRVLWTRITGVGVGRVASNRQWRRLVAEEVERMIGVWRR